MKKAFIFLLLCVSNIFASENVFYEILYENKDFVQFSKNNDIFFYNLSKNGSTVLINSKLNKEKITSIETNKNSYMELNYKNDRLEISNIIGEFSIYSYNSHISTFTKFAGIIIDNYVSNYHILVLPKRLVYIFVDEGKIKINRDRDNVILIAGESLVIENGKFSLSDYPDYLTGKNIMFNKILIDYKNQVEKLDKRYKTSNFDNPKLFSDRKYLEYVYLKNIYKNDPFSE
ncbi:MAG TPA: hypothetical protein PK385_05675 [Spirochaetota bacterium]|nr:hypothetical protein [Spirochaetota bacterium]HOS33044.1 hypothetical protein [Spirochaetota bacterium]HOS55527.1 hypothetical protein [Spirochaetota bacterium]HQF78100.1 hypothetical protein [Spirochaetota bacterium]HQH30883.1 hypothetical protein [Spirochaetota bacterium]